MGLDTCNYCGADVSTSDQSCPQCGRVFPEGDPVQPARMVGDTPERNYLGATISYLDCAHKGVSELARTMAGAADGSSTPDDIRQKLKEVQLVENTGYTGDYRNRISGLVPARYRSLAGNVDETHRLFQSSTKEMLEYWEDQNLKHLTSGQVTLKKCILLMNESIKLAGRKLDELTKEKSKKAAIAPRP